MTVRAPLTLTLLLAALLSAVMPSGGRISSVERGHDASLRVDRLAEHAAPWRAAVTPVVTALPSVPDRVSRDGGKLPTPTVVSAPTPFAIAARRAIRNASPHSALPAPHSARHRVGFDATAPPHTPHRAA